MNYSVLMSVYYKENPYFLKRAIESILNQTIKSNDFIIVCDGSLTDELNEVLEEYACKENSNISLIRLDRNYGLGIALAKGLTYCKNEYVARMDSDDISLPNRIEEQLKILENDSDIDIIGGDIAEFIEEGHTVSIRKVPAEDNEIKEYMKVRCPFNHMTVVFKKSAVEKAGGYKSWHYNEDYYLWIRMYLSGCKFANTGTIVLNARVGKDMYARRGGYKYFISEKRIQDYMINNSVINLKIWFLNVTKRFIIEVMLPNNIRSYLFKKFARD